MLRPFLIQRKLEKLQLIPLIGLTTYRTKNPFAFQQDSLSEAYTQAVVQAGGSPILIPSGLPETALDSLISRLDGLLFTGGGDIAPETYGSTQHPLVDGVDKDRDRIEIYLMKKILETKLPFMGICRGFQVINVAMGGSLYEDILDN